MKKFVILGLVLLMAMVAAPVMARGPNNIGKAGKSPIVRMNLYQKTGVPDWEIVEDGAWGRVIINIESGKLVFNGHGLPEGIEYTLISYGEPEDPGDWLNSHSIECLGEGVVNEEGDIHIMSNIGDDDLICNEYGENADGDYTRDEGVKVWLVLSEDVGENCESMIDWDSAEYLFEDDLIRCTCPEEE
ncbi:MAG: hypothetical protein ACOC6G_04535 [Thermoproteota archaeon]